MVPVLLHLELVEVDASITRDLPENVPCSYFVPNSINTVLLRYLYLNEYLHIPIASTAAWPDHLPLERTNADTPPLAVEGCVDNDNCLPEDVLVAASCAEA